MPASLVHSINNLSQAKYGVNIQSVPAPAAAKTEQLGVVGIVGEFPWGPYNTITEITSSGAFFDTFAPTVFGDAELDKHPAVKALVNKQLSKGARIVRVAATGNAKADSGAISAGTGSIEFVAKYAGTFGNLITAAIAVNADTATLRDVTVSIGTLYSKTYPALDIAGILAIDDPYLDVEDSSATDVPGATSGALTGGLDGTAVGADYTGGPSSNVGIRLFYSASADADILFVAEPQSTAIINATNVALYDYLGDVSFPAAVVYATDPVLTVTTAKTYFSDVAGMGRDSLGWMSWPMVNTINPFDPNKGETEVNPNSFFAACVAAQEAWDSPAGANGAPYLRGISSVSQTHSASIQDYNDLNAAGVAPMFIEKTLGNIIHKGVTTSLTSGEESIQTATLKKYIESGLTSATLPYLSKNLDVTLSPNRLGSNTRAIITGYKSFLTDLVNQERIQEYSVDPFGSVTQAQLDAGIWVVDIYVKSFNSADVIVIRSGISPTQNISS